MAWPKGRKLSASHKAAISRSLKGRKRAVGQAVREKGQASKAIVKRTLGNKQTRKRILIGTGVAVVGAGALAYAARNQRNGFKLPAPTIVTRKGGITYKTTRTALPVTPKLIMGKTVILPSPTRMVETQAYRRGELLGSAMSTRSLIKGQGVVNSVYVRRSARREGVARGMLTQQQGMFSGGMRPARYRSDLGQALTKGLAGKAYARKMDAGTSKISKNLGYAFRAESIAFRTTQRPRRPRLGVAK